MCVVLERPEALAKWARLIVLNRTVVALAGLEKGHVVIKHGRIMAISPKLELWLCLIRQFRYSRPKSFTYNDLQILRAK